MVTIPVEKLTKQGNQEINPYSLFLKEQGINFKPQIKYLENRFLIKYAAGKRLGGPRDEKTGLVTENGDLREGLAVGLTETIRRGENWAVMTIDLDQLKKANTDIGRLFGDVYISWGARKAIDILKENDQGESLLGKTVVFKEGKTSDEIKLWFFGVNKKELEEIKKLNDIVNQSSQELKIKKSNKKVKFNFSLSSGLVTSKDKNIQRKIKKTLEKQPAVFWNLFNLVNDLSDLKADRIKLSKDISRFQKILDQVREKNSITELNQWLVKEYGDGRIKTSILSLILKITEISSVNYLNSHHSDAVPDLLKKLSISAEELKNITSIEGLQVIFDKIFAHETRSILEI